MYTISARIATIFTLPVWCAIQNLSLRALFRLCGSHVLNMQHNLAFRPGDAWMSEKRADVVAASVNGFVDTAR